MEVYLVFPIKYYVQFYLFSFYVKILTEIVKVDVTMEIDETDLTATETLMLMFQVSIYFL
jgi:hypothetical protein